MACIFPGRQSREQDLGRNIAVNCTLQVGGADIWATTGSPALRWAPGYFSCGSGPAGVLLSPREHVTGGLFSAYRDGATDDGIWLGPGAPGVAEAGAPGAGAPGATAPGPPGPPGPPKRCGCIIAWCLWWWPW